MLAGIRNIGIIVNKGQLNQFQSDLPEKIIILEFKFNTKNYY